VLVAGAVLAQGPPLIGFCVRCPRVRPNGAGAGLFLAVVVVLVLLWLAIGVAAAVQRGYLQGPADTCARTSTIVVTVLAGPLNAVGANPKIDCTLPQPSP
jgi:hypothetical protein